MGRKSKRSIAAKKSRRKWAVEPPTVQAGQVIGELRCIQPDTGERRSGKRVGLWEDIKTGERKPIINSDVVSGKTVSAGRIKKENFKNHAAKQKLLREMETEALLGLQSPKEVMREPGQDITTYKPRTAPTIEVPFYQTDAGFEATQVYFNEFRQMPAEDFDLESYWKGRQAKLKAEREARRKKPA